MLSEVSIVYPATNSSAVCLPIATAIQHANPAAASASPTVPSHTNACACRDSRRCPGSSESASSTTATTA